MLKLFSLYDIMGMQSTILWRVKMKKHVAVLIYALSVISLLLLSISGCNADKGADVWDGSIAETFASGDGSEKDPYTIKSASQLAFLAREVNAGTDYQGKYISLKCDLDLNGCEWTPIGNGTNAFNGIFDGNSHTISNLKITRGTTFTADYAGGQSNQYTTGLFGSCYNATIKGITIDKASISVQNLTNADAIMSGVLIGIMRSDSISEISDIQVENADMTCSFELENRATSLRIGGIIGYVYGGEGSSIKMGNINSDTTISIENGHGANNLIGGIVGVASTQNLFDVCNCASYVSVKINADTYTQNDSFGAFGSVTARNNTISISNIYSKVTTNKICDTFHGSVAYNANAIIGETYHAKQQDGTRIGGYEFKNLFGYVEQVDASTGENAKSTQLYEFPSDAVYTETNCRGCESVPADHGFDASVWDLTDLARPQVKAH